MAAERILLTGRIEEGLIHYQISPLPVQEQPQNGELQRLMSPEATVPNDEGEQTADYESWLEDEEWIRRGGS